MIVGFRRQELVQTDPETGEVMPGLIVHIPERGKLKAPFMLFSRIGCIRLARMDDLNGEDHRVLNSLFAVIEYENWIHTSQQDIAEMLGMQKQNVSRSIKRLVEKKIIIEGPKVGRSKTFRLNAFFGWKGRINKEYADTYEAHMKLSPSEWEMERNFPVLPSENEKQA